MKKSDDNLQILVTPNELSAQSGGTGDAIIEVYESPNIEELGRVTIITLKSGITATF